MPTDPNADIERETTGAPYVEGNLESDDDAAPSRVVSWAHAGPANTASSAEVSIALRGTALYVFIAAPSPGKSVMAVLRRLTRFNNDVGGLGRCLTAL